MKFRSIISFLAVIALSFPGHGAYSASPKAKSTDKVNYSFLHAIPLGNGADKVDVYSNNKLLLDNAIPGQLSRFTVDRGTIQIKVYADGITPASSTPALLISKEIYLVNGADVTFVAQLNQSAKPELNIYKNMITAPGKKRSWLTIRHVAAAPAVDIRTDGKVAFSSVSNSVERKSSLAIKTYSVDAVLPDTHTTIVIPAATITLKSDVNTVVYAWGSAAQNNLKFAIQEIPVRK